MKHPLDDKTVDWVGAPKSQIVAFERIIAVLKCVESVPVATTAVIREKVAPFLTKRSVQRCIQGLVCTGYLKEKKSGGDESRYFITDKTKQLFGVKG
ncbi:winged helix-turn-helix domain-containing protein [Acinetobacter sp. BSP-28]|uniref:winged helix-turn-helix domain-containing protein n=1 Tax=Acinetobacter sp. BSP-28 TaxID=3344661 RepID=UPI00377009C8